MNRLFVLREQSNKRMLDAFLDANWHGCAVGGRPLAVTIAEYKSKRSADQNRMYWALLRQIADGAWVDGRQFDSEAWHELLRRKYIGLEEVTLPGGEQITRGISTTGLTVPEFSAYIEQIMQFAADELGLEII